MGKSSLGWWSISSPGVRRVGPHWASSDNPREIGFRNDDTADLLAAVMWLTRTGNGGKRKDVPVTQWHGIRPSNAKFGSSNSDHHAGVAMDQNWSNHPWEVATGSAAYDRHMSDKRFSVEHTLFAEIEARLTVPGKPAVVRWAGRPWRTDMGWTAYARGNRDCMHWVIGTTNEVRIREAANYLRSWFKPPRTVADIKKLQKKLGVKQDGDWNDASIKAMRAEQKRLGVIRTGLPGDEATIKAWAKEASAPKPDENVRRLQRTLNSYAKAKLAVDGLFGDNTLSLAKVVARETQYTGKSSDVVGLTKHVEDYMVTLEQLKQQLDRVEKKVDAKPTAKDMAAAVWGYVSEAHGPFNAWWWLRRGAVFNKKHKQFPADPNSPADVERQVAEKILEKDVPPYLGE